MQMHLGRCSSFYSENIQQVFTACQTTHPAVGPEGKSDAIPALQRLWSQCFKRANVNGQLNKKRWQLLSEREAQKSKGHLEETPKSAGAGLLEQLRYGLAFPSVQTPRNETPGGSANA